MSHWSIAFGLFFGLMSITSNGVFGQIGYTRHVSDLRIKELRRLAVQLNRSIYKAQPPCEKYYEYVCNRNQPLFSIMGNLPCQSELIDLTTDIQTEAVNFDAKNKMTDFILSCNLVKPIDDCYREAYDYFRPIFGYIVANQHLDTNDHNNLLDLLTRFIARAHHTDTSDRHPLITKLELLKDKLRHPALYFQISDLNKEYKNVRIYRDGYYHNIKSLEDLRASNNETYVHGPLKTILDWTMYMFQSRNKPMSYYMSTLNVHLWMMFYNATARKDEEKYKRVADCLKLSPLINVLDEARMMAVIYIKSFQHASAQYRDWIISSDITQEIYNYENEILKPYELDNKRLFFTLYAQNFCDFGKEIAENVFFLGLKQNLDFYTVYGCGHQTPKGVDCLLS